MRLLTSRLLENYTHCHLSLIRDEMSPSQFAVAGLLPAQSIDTKVTKCQYVIRIMLWLK